MCRFAAFSWETFSEQRLEEESEITTTEKSPATAPSGSLENAHEEVIEEPPSYRSVFPEYDNNTTIFSAENISSDKVKDSSSSSTRARQNPINDCAETPSLALSYELIQSAPPPRPPRRRPPPPPYSTAEADQIGSVHECCTTGQISITTTKGIEESIRSERHDDPIGSSRPMWLSTAAVDSLARFSRFLALLVTSRLVVSPMTGREKMAVAELIRARWVSRYSHKLIPLPPRRSSRMMLVFGKNLYVCMSHYSDINREGSGRLFYGKSCFSRSSTLFNKTLVCSNTSCQHVCFCLAKNDRWSRLPSQPVDCTSAVYIYFSFADVHVHCFWCCFVRSRTYTLTPARPASLSCLSHLTAMMGLIETIIQRSRLAAVSVRR